MGYTLKLVITSAVAPDVVRAVLEEAASLWPSIRLGRNASAGAGPFGQWYLSGHAHFAAGGAAEGGGPDDEALTVALSRRFPSLAVAFIAVECFGGDCGHAGSVWRDGHLIHREVFDDDPSGHRRLLAHVGITLADDHFAPFARGYFADT